VAVDDADYTVADRQRDGENAAQREADDALLALIAWVAECVVRQHRLAGGSDALDDCVADDELVGSERFAVQPAGDAKFEFAGVFAAQHDVAALGTGELDNF